MEKVSCTVSDVNVMRRDFADRLVYSNLISFLFFQSLVSSCNAMELGWNWPVLVIGTENLMVVLPTNMKIKQCISS